MTFVFCTSFEHELVLKVLTSCTQHVKFIYSEKATKFCEISAFLLTIIRTVKSKVKILQNFVASSEYMNFTKLKINKELIINFGSIEETMALCCSLLPVTSFFCYFSSYLRQMQDLEGNSKYFFVVEKVPQHLTGLQELQTCLHNPWKHRKSCYWPLCPLGGVDQAILDPSIFQSGLNFANSLMIQILCVNW